MCDDKTKPSKQDAKASNFIAGDASAIQQLNNFRKYGTKYPTQDDIDAYAANKDQPKTPRR